MASEIKPDFHLPTEIYIRQGLINDIGDILPGYCTRPVLVVTSPDLELFQAHVEQISNNLKKSGIGCIIYDDLPASPNSEEIDTAVSFIKKTNCDLILGFGGTNSVNAAKAVSLLVNNFIFCNDLFSKTDKINPPLPFISVPAYPLSGFEIAPLFYLLEIHGLTYRVYHNNLLYPKSILVDPELSLKIDDSRMIKTALSTLAIAIESVISKKNNDIVNTYALKSIDMIFRNLPLAFRESENIMPRKFLSTAAVMSGIAFSTSYLSISMAISLALSSRCEIDVESAMSVVLSHIMEFNLTTSPAKYVQMSKVMGEDVKEITVIEAAIKSIEAIRKLETEVDVPQRLIGYDIPKTILKEIAELSISYPFIENAPREMNKSEIETILISAY